MSLTKYKTKRNFEASPEPTGKTKEDSVKLAFVVQRHKATRLHYDFRLEAGGVLKSWAVPKGPSMNPGDKRLAMMVEDHPYDYKDFQGVIPEGNYGAGIVEIWDSGTYSDFEGNGKKITEKKILEEIEKGDVKFRLNGQKLKGEFALVKLRNSTAKDNSWLLIKHKDEFAVTDQYNSEEQTSSDSPINQWLIKNKKKSPKASSIPATKDNVSQNNKARDFIKPMLAQETARAFDNNEWLFEIKWDGYRAIADISAGNVKLYSRNYKVFNNEYPVIIEDLKKITDDVVLDGEVVLLNSENKPDFGKLQDYRSNTNFQLCYYVFDVLYHNGKNISDRPLIERKKLLRRIIEDTDAIKYTDHIVGEGKSFFEVISEIDLEGIMAKKMDSLYYPGIRSSSWLKIKKNSSCPVFIVGFTKPTGSRKYFGSLVLAFKDDDGLKYAGHVGTGFNETSLKEIYSLLEPLITPKSHFNFKIPTKTQITWVTPQIQCEVKFSQLTKGGIMRQPVFVDIIKKKINVMENTTKQITKNADKIYSFGDIQVKVTHFNKIYFPDDHITKGMIADYYQQVADYIIPYLKGRPESLKRNPNGIKDKGFFHKDAGEEAPEWVESTKLYSESAKKDIDYILCNDKATLAYLNNLGCIEINPWHSTVDVLDNPDYMIIDIDPSPKNTFNQVIEVAKLVKVVLDRCKAPCFCKTSGATGMHVYVPLAKKYPYENVKDFAYLICLIVNEQVPGFTSVERNLAKRGDNIYLDHLQNRRGQTIASVYSVRPFPGATVSIPLAWDEVKEGLDPHQFNIYSVPERIKQKGDLFKGVLGNGIDLEKCLEALNPGDHP